MLGRGKSQCGQDRIISELHKQLPRWIDGNGKSGGFFIDLAANDATHMSNTYNILEREMGWKGLCVEPNPLYWPRLVQRKGCTIVAAVLGATVGEEVQFILHEETRGRQASGGIVDDRFDNKAARPKSNSKPVNMFTTTLTDVLERFRVPPTIDYLSLDVEGAEYYVMEYFPFERYTINFLTIERPKQELIDLLYYHGYQYLGSNNEYGMETLWVHGSVIGAKTSDFHVKVQTILSKEGWNFKESTKWLEFPQDDKAEVQKPRVIWKD
ncbi:hypothetical protein ACHAWF_001099 [Thalassiosira exigua]